MSKNTPPTTRRWTICLVQSVLTLGVLLLASCYTMVYHDLEKEQYITPEWYLMFDLGDMTWLTAASGDSMRLARTTTIKEEVAFYLHFRPDSSMDYYGLSARAALRKLSEEIVPTVFRQNVSFISLALEHEAGTLTLYPADLLTQRWEYSGSDYVGIGPIPVPKASKLANLCLTVVMRTSEDQVADTLSFELPIERKRLTRSHIIEPWP